MTKIPMFIDVKKLHPHPYNPRKDLGDLSELIGSIKAQGILQNLTVVPWFSEITRVGCDDPKQQEEMGFRVVIGHRRLAAAKSAGLKEVPCIVVDMTMNEQLATMMAENMQRQDLTVYEQAHGIQMMLDFGESVLSVSEKTGFSKTTVRRRIKLLELDQQKLKAAVDKGIPLADFLELDKIEDLTERNKVLIYIGTNNFRYMLENAIRRQDNKHKYDKAIEIIKEWAIEATDDEWANCRHYRSVRLFDPEKLEELKPNDLESRKYMYQKAGPSNDYSFIHLGYFAPVELGQENSEPEEVSEASLRSEALNEVWKNCQKLRVAHIHAVTNRQAANLTKETMKHLLMNNLEYMSKASIEDMSSFFGVDSKELKDEVIRNSLEGRIELIALVSVYLTLDPISPPSWQLPFDYKAVYRWNANRLNAYSRLQGFMKATGYEASDDEINLFNGTHELYLASLAVNEEAEDDSEEEDE